MNRRGPLRFDGGAAEYRARYAEPGCPFRFVYTGETVKEGDR